MNLNKLKGARVSAGLDTQDVALALNLSPDLYRKKERGEVKFSIPEFERFAIVVGLNLVQIGDILFDGKVPVGTVAVPYVL